MKLGDVVVLKSGGPKMTIENISTEGSIKCIWYCDSTFQYKNGQFEKKTLVKE
jgi:uncharacterized protein YodC (DUF2158 family)